MYDALIKLNSIKDLYSFVDILDKHSGTCRGCQITDEYAKPRSFEAFRAFV